MLAYFVYSFFELGLATLGNKDIALPTEVFLQFTYQLDLDFLERLKLRNVHKDYNGFLAMTNLSFHGCCYIWLPQLGLEFCVHLQLKESLEGAGLIHSHLAS